MNFDAPTVRVAGVAHESLIVTKDDIGHMGRTASKIAALVRRQVDKGIRGRAAYEAVASQIGISAQEAMVIVALVDPHPSTAGSR